MGLARTIALASLVACRAARPVPPAPRDSEVHVAATACVAADDVRASVSAVLIAHRADHAGLVIDIVAASTEAATDVELRVLRRDGDVGLDRRYALVGNDCASAPQLLALGVDRWLSAFPEWAEPAEPPRPATRWLEVVANVTASAIAPPVGVDGELGMLVDLGGAADRFGVVAVARGGLPLAAGAGQFLQIAALGGAAWRHRFTRWETRVEIRGGALRVSGIGFAQNDATWVPWAELALFAGRRWSWGALGVELAAAPIRDRAVTRDGLVSQDIPLARLGFSATFEIYR